MECIFIGEEFAATITPATEEEKGGFRSRLEAVEAVFTAEARHPRPTQSQGNGNGNNP